MRVRATTMAAALGAVTTWMAVPLVSLARGRSLDDRARARVRAAAFPALAPSASVGTVVRLQPSSMPWAAVPAPRPAADAGRRAAGVR